ncbi:MAG TPA: ATP-dependent DNA ligase [Kofleriaceae bacterium]|nr:ATP-dependent DNA ligase [Kofleriaceae bacterium]
MVRLRDLVVTSTAVAGTRSRLEKIDRLAAFVRQLEPDEVRPAVSYLAGVVPQGKLGVGWATLSGAGEAAPATDGADVTDGASSDASASSDGLSVRDVHRALDELAAASGRGSTGERRRILDGLIGRAAAVERDFLLRLIGGELRQGALEGMMVEAVARAAAVDAARVRRAFMLAGDLGAVAEAVLIRGAAALDAFAVQLFRPLLPMLAQPAGDTTDAIDRLGEAAFEYKLDGARVQVHKRGEEVRVYSRGLNEVTGSVPELVELAAALPARELILDGEAIALRQDGRPQSFQTTMRRFGRKLEVAAVRAALPLHTWFFDALLVDGQSLLERSTRERIAALAGVVPAELTIPRVITGDRERAAALLAESLAAGHEGLMAKSLDATYEAGSRGQNWLKVKVARTFDLVVIGVEWGSGRRRGWLSNLHLGARDPASGTFVMVGKTFKGMTDEMLTWQTERLLALESSREGHVVFVRPELVVEVAISDVQESPHYPGGIALRFARVKRYRADKQPAEADTLAALQALLPGS